MEQLYTPIKDTSFPNAFFKRGEVRTKAQWIKYMPGKLKLEFDKFFTRTK